MANTTLNWQFREALPLFREGARLPVYVSYLLHANARGRSWPSIDLLVKETGYERAAVVKAKKWLLEMGAIERVAYDKRIGAEEKKLQRRLHVVQITGELNTSSGALALLYFNSSPNELLDGANSSPIKSSKIKRSRREPKVVTSKTPEDNAIKVEGKDSSATAENRKPLLDAIVEVCEMNSKLPESYKLAGGILKKLPAATTPEAIKRAAGWWHSENKGKHLIIHYLPALMCEIGWHGYVVPGSTEDYQSYATGAFAGEIIA